MTTTTTTVRIPADQLAGIRLDLAMARDLILQYAGDGRLLPFLGERDLIDLAVATSGGCLGIHWGRAPKPIREAAGRRFRLAYVLCSSREGAQQLCRTIRSQGYAALHRIRVRPYQVEVRGTRQQGYCVVVLLAPNPDAQAQGWWQAPTLEQQPGTPQARRDAYEALLAEEQAEAEAAGRICRDRGDADVADDERGAETDWLFVERSREDEFHPTFAADNLLGLELWRIEHEIDVFWANDPRRKRAAERARERQQPPMLTVAQTNTYVDRQLEARAQRFRERAAQRREPSPDVQLQAAGTRERLSAMIDAFGDSLTLLSEDVAWDHADDELGA